MNVVAIPLSPAPQTFRTQIGGKSFRLTFTWNVAMACWLLAIQNLAGEYLVRSVPIVTGLELLGQLTELFATLGFTLIATTDRAPDEVPTFQNLGIAGRVYAITP